MMAFRFRQSPLGMRSKYWRDILSDVVFVPCLTYCERAEVSSCRIFQTTEIRYFGMAYITVLRHNFQSGHETTIQPFNCLMGAL